MADVRVHVLSIRDNAEDETLIQKIWGTDPEIALTHVVCGAEALEYLQTPERKLPNLILLAWRFNENQLTALETLSALKADGALRPVPVVVLAGKLKPIEIHELYEHQISCIFEMPAAAPDLRRILKNVKNLWLNGARLPYEQQTLYQREVRLSEREIQVLRLTAEDLGIKQIAFKLGISAKTVEFHRRSIMDRLGVQGTAGMVRYAIKTRLLEP
jgi:DNA-binding NarL/FixJ family response regulator